jgi:hypothetical protein
VAAERTSRPARTSPRKVARKSPGTISAYRRDSAPLSR